MTGATTSSTVVGVFHSRTEADQAVAELRRAGFRDDQIGYVMPDERATTTTAGSDYAGEGAVAGAVGGGVLGGLAGALAAGLIPGIGPVIAAGILSAALGGAAIGAAAGGIAGALIGMGIPEEEAHYYEGEFRSGRILVTVRAEGRAAEARTILHRHGAYDRAMAGQAGTLREGQKLRLHEEELRAHKQPVQTGEVHVRKDVVTEHKTVEVPVSREEVVIERRPVSGPASSSEIRPGEEVRIPVKEEQVRVEKVPVAKEEVTVAKRTVHDTEQVSGTVRKEQVRVEKEGDVDVHNASTTDRSRGKKS